MRSSTVPSIRLPIPARCCGSRVTCASLLHHERLAPGVRVRQRGPPDPQDHLCRRRDLHVLVRSFPERCDCSGEALPTRQPEAGFYSDTSSTSFFFPRLLLHGLTTVTGN
ncbi:hypothetical protein CEXT_327221 [Caerostris extrusa]|uniref:Uncharacterized protein n=1 Tax=Caerostris extrusa TaxID=172846 RepID=A0AAV4S0C9_CAEEX|nr:hypothetical protein CEXT_327221 [Caerostris extrusa]